MPSQPLQKGRRGRPADLHPALSAAVLGQCPRGGRWLRGPPPRLPVTAPSWDSRRLHQSGRGFSLSWKGERESTGPSRARSLRGPERQPWGAGRAETLRTHRQVSGHIRCHPAADVPPRGGPWGSQRLPRREGTVRSDLVDRKPHKDGLPRAAGTAVCARAALSVLRTASAS